MTDRLRGAVAAFEPRGPALAWGRSMLGLATLTVILFTSEDALFPYTDGVPEGRRCGGVRAVGLWCVAGPGRSPMWLARILAVAVLCWVIAGYRPRWSCVPHFYVAFSFASASVIVNGGDKFAQTAAMLLVPVCLGDGRRWHWQRVDAPMSPALQGSAYAAVLTARGQLFVIYAGSALAKLLDPAWRRGDAMFLIAYGPDFGLAGPVREASGSLLHAPGFVAVLSWAVIALETSIAVGVPGPRSFRLAALVGAVAFHLAIVLGLGLVSFGLTMIAFVLIACCPGPRVATSRPALSARFRERMIA